jgi:hypothetical protein
VPAPAPEREEEKLALGRKKKEVADVGDEHHASVRVPAGFEKLNPGGSRRRFRGRRPRHGNGGGLKGSK